MARVNCTNCGRDTQSKTALCTHCRPIDAHRWFVDTDFGDRREYIGEGLDELYDQVEVAMNEAIGL